MKKLLLVLVFSFTTFIFAQSVRISVNDGLGTNPFVWNCTCIPLPNDSIIINHNITLNVDFGFTDGAVVINPTGQLMGDSPNRNFAFSGSANFVNNGNFDVARVGFFGGTAYNGGTFAADSFYTGITTAPGWISNGDMDIQYSYWNTGLFTMGVGSEMIVGYNFYNGDSLVSGVNAVLLNNGDIRVNGDFANSDTLKGSGQVCIYGNSANLGIITGTLDMCDNSGGGQVDYNLGTIGVMVTTCVAPCNIGINEEATIKVEVFPNPATDHLQIKSPTEINVMIFDMLGEQIFISSNPLLQHNISTAEWNSGVYTYRVFADGVTGTGKIIKQ